MFVMNLLTMCVAFVSILKIDASARLKHSLEALSRGLTYMKDHVQEINLDGVVGSRFVEEQLQAYLQFEPDVFERIQSEIEELHNLAHFVSGNGMKHVNENDKNYSADVGRIMDKSTRLLWYPRRRTNPRAVTSPVPCSQSFFNSTLSNSCLRQATGSWDNTVKPCTITNGCVQWATETMQRNYVLTHQMLYWQLLEMRNCIVNISPLLQEYLCSNVMRDANSIADADFPISHQDLFMEQVGLCGMWGFADFYKPEWLDKILEWQLPSGCYSYFLKFHCSDVLIPDAKIRVKRREKLFTDGCLSHKTGMALMAITVSIRFEAERLYDELIK